MIKNPSGIDVRVIDQKWHSRIEIDSTYSPPGEYRITYGSFNTKVDFNTVLKTDELIVTILPSPPSLQKKLKTKTLTAGLAEDWEIPEVVNGTNEFVSMSVEPSESLKDYISFDEDNKIISYSGSKSLADLYEKKDLKILIILRDEENLENTISQSIIIVVEPEKEKTLEEVMLEADKTPFLVIFLVTISLLLIIPIAFLLARKFCAKCHRRIQTYHCGRGGNYGLLRADSHPNKIGILISNRCYGETRKSSLNRYESVHDVERDHYNGKLLLKSMGFEEDEITEFFDASYDDLQEEFEKIKTGLSQDVDRKKTLICCIYSGQGVIQTDK